jgi:signal transduction histidine kinase
MPVVLRQFDVATLELAALLALLTAIVLVTIAVSAVTALRSSRRQIASLLAIDFVRGSFASRLAQGEAMEELLPRVAGMLRDNLALDAAEIWIAANGVLRLSVAQPDRPPTGAPTPRGKLRGDPGDGPPPPASGGGPPSGPDGPPPPASGGGRDIALTAAEESIVARAPISGSAWASVWLPRLLAARGETALRIAPISDANRLLGLIVLERAHNGERLATEADATLEELAREVGRAINKASLDEALQESLARLQRQAEDLQASRARIVHAADAERRRIERNLHDGAQQYLVALAVKARIVQRLVDRDPERARTVSGELAQDVERAIEELRDLAHGIYPPLLSGGGLGAALAAACRRSGVPAGLEADALGRYHPDIEAAVYFCCVEALQNAAKHAGPGANVAVRVWEEEGALLFEVADDGAGFTPDGRPSGAGLANMSDRLGAVGGLIRLEAALGSGTKVRGVVPVARTATSRKW